MARSFSIALALAQRLLRLLGNRATLMLLSLLFLLALLAWIAILLSQFGFASNPSNQFDKLHLPQVALQPIGRIEPRELEQQFFGIVQARRSVDLSAKFSDRLSAILVDVGDSVAAGQPLVELEKRDHLTALAVAQAELNVVQAKLLEMQRGPREEELASARAAVEERRAMAQLHRSNFERMTLAAQSLAVSPSEIDDANFMSQASSAQFEQAQQRLAELQAGTRQEHIDSQTALVTAQQARVSQLEARLADCTIVAPFDGKVQKRWIDEGALVAPLQPIVTIVESQVMEVHVGLPPSSAETLSRRLQSGADIQKCVAVQIRGVSYAVSVSSLAPALEPHTGTILATFVLPYAENIPFSSGESAAVIVKHSPVEGHWLPLSALSSLPQGVWGVWIARSTEDPTVFQLEHRPVEILNRQQEWVQVSGKLAANELFIPEGVSRLSIGQFVRCRELDHP